MYCKCVGMCVYEYSVCACLHMLRVFVCVFQKRPTIEAKETYYRVLACTCCVYLYVCSVCVGMHAVCLCVFMCVCVRACVCVCIYCVFKCVFL
jgi:hypothetical protein